MLDSRFDLVGDHFVANISLPENHPGGLSVVERDPRKQDEKPDCYVGIVEAVGPDCRFLKVGDKVVFERWEYTQLDMDEERLIAREIDLVVMPDEKPAPNAVAFQILDDRQAKYKELILPEMALAGLDVGYHFGKVTGSGCVDMSEGDFVWVMKMDSNQFRVGRHTVVCRLMSDEAFMKGVLVPALNVIS